MKKKRIRFSFFYLVLLVVFYALSGCSKSEKTDFSGFLKEVAKSKEDFPIQARAAEALADNNFDIEPGKIFAPVLKRGCEKKIVALGVLAKAHSKDTVVHDSLSNEILTHFLNSEEKRTKLTALETMGKSGLYFPNEEIQSIAADSSGKMQVMAQWVLSNSGERDDLAALVEFLFSPDTAQVHYASYALTYKSGIPSDLYKEVEKCYNAMEKGHPYRVYLVSALYRNAPLDTPGKYKDELLAYSDGEDHERKEVFQALSRKGSEEDMEFIYESFEDPDLHVKVAVADAYLANEHYLQSKICWLDWAILFVYGLLLVGIGWYYSYRQKNKEDYYLGGRSAHPLFTGISLYVSYFSAITYLAIPGEVIKYGPLYALAAIVGAPIIVVIASYWVIPYFMNLKIISAYEILKKPLGEGVRRVGSVVFIITRFLWMGLLIFLASKAMVVMMGWELGYTIYVIVALGVITIFYTSMGGLKAVLLTDVIQFFILLIGAVMTISIVAFEFGSVVSLIPASGSTDWQDIPFVSFDPYIRLTIFFAFINNIAWWICTTGSDQMAIQRFLSTKDLRSARRTFLNTQTGLVVITVLLMFVGFSVMRFYNVHPNLLPSQTGAAVEADFLFPHFIANQFPIGMSGLVIAALFSASMSSLSSGVNSVGSIITADILPAVFKDRDNLDSIRNIRIISVFIGIVVILLSLVIDLVPGNIIEVTTKTNGLFVAPLFNLFVNALFVKKAKPFGVVMGSVYGFMAALTIGFWDVLTGNPPMSFLWITIMSFLVSVISSLIFNVVFGSVRGRKSLLWGIILMLPWIGYYLLII